MGFRISFESSLCCLSSKFKDYFSFPGLHLMEYFGVASFELIFAGIKFLSVSNFVSFELYRLVVVFGEISFTGSYGLPYVIRIIFFESFIISGFDSLLLSSRMRISMANFDSKSISLRSLSGCCFCYKFYYPPCPPCVYCYFFDVLCSEFRLVRILWGTNYASSCACLKLYLDFDLSLLLALLFYYWLV